MSKVEEKLAAMGLSLPEPPVPVAAYVPGVLCDDLVFVSGQLPLKDGQLQYKGSLGIAVSTEEGVEAARLCALNCLGVLKSIAGDLDRVEKIVKVTGYVNSMPDYTEHPKVVNGVSELLGEVFEEAGRHARAAVGCSSLPLGAACEIEMIVKINP